MAEISKFFIRKLLPVACAWVVGPPPTLAACPPKSCVAQPPRKLEKYKYYKNYLLAIDYVSQSKNSSCFDVG